MSEWKAVVLGALTVTGVLPGLVCGLTPWWVAPALAIGGTAWLLR